MDREVFEALKHINTAIRTLLLETGNLHDRLKKVEKWVDAQHMVELDNWDDEFA